LQRAAPAIPPALPSQKKQFSQALSSGVASQVEASPPMQQASAHEASPRAAPAVSSGFPSRT
jgi:hypothetical protein